MKGYARRLFIAGLLIAGAMSPAQAATQIQPGQWETTSTVESVDMPGAPPQVSRMMNGKTTRASYCITPEQAAKGPQEMFKQNPSCRFTKFSMTGGAISTEMSCSQNGATMIARSQGSYTPTSYSATATMTMSGKMSMRMTSRSTGRRLGPCTGK